MSYCAEAARVTPDERIHEVASILAIGILRLQQRAALPSDEVSKKPSELSAQGLEVSGKTVLSVHTS